MIMAVERAAYVRFRRLLTAKTMRFYCSDEFKYFFYSSITDVGHILYNIIFLMLLLLFMIGI